MNLTVCIESMLQAAGAVDRGSFALRAVDDNGDPLVDFQSQLRITSSYEGTVRIVKNFWLCIHAYWEAFQQEHLNHFKRGVPRLYFGKKPRRNVSTPSSPDGDAADIQEGAKFLESDGPGWVDRWEEHVRHTFIQYFEPSDVTARPHSA